MVVNSKVVAEHFNAETAVPVTVYGFSFYRDGSPDDIVKCLHNVLCDRERAEQFSRLINSNDLHEVHIDDVIDDLLAE